MRRLSPPAFFLFLSLLYVAALRAEEPPSYREPEFKEGAAAYTQKEAEALVEEVLPLVEKAAGRTFKTKPKLVYANRDQIAASMSHDMLPQIQKLHPSIPVNEAARIALDNAIMASPLLLARYSYADADLCLCPNNPPTLFAALKVDAKEIKPIVRLVAAFELVHALQDQELGLAKLLNAARDGESSLALNMALKGQAAWILDAVAKELKTPEDTLAFARTMAVNVIKRNAPSVDMQAQAYFLQIYRDGLGFVKFQVEKGGMEQVWKVLASPPSDTNMILKPETYAPATRVYRDYAKVLEGLEKELDPKEDKTWNLQRMTLGPSMLRSAYARLEATQRDTLALHFEAGQSLVAVNRPSGGMGNFTVLVFKDAASAIHACGILEAFTKQELDRTKKNDPIVKVEGPDATDLKGVKADYARRLAFAVEVPGEPVMTQQVVRVARGRNVLEYVDQNIGLPADKISAFAEKTLKKLEDLEREPAP